MIRYVPSGHKATVTSQSVRCKSARPVRSGAFLTLNEQHQEGSSSSAKQTANKTAGSGQQYHHPPRRPRRPPCSHFPLIPPPHASCLATRSPVTMTRTGAQRAAEHQCDQIHPTLADDTRSLHPRVAAVNLSTEGTPRNSVAGHGALDGPIDPIGFWVEEGRWPEEGWWPEEPSNMEHLLARKKSSSSSFGRKRSNPATYTTPSDEKPREQKSAPYRDVRYELLLQTKGTYMDTCDLGITDASKHLVWELLHTKQPVPKETLFDEATFVDACRHLQGRNEAKVIQDISRLIVPSAEALAIQARELRLLIESVNEGWNNSIPLTGTRPQPDYSVGFRREAFTEDQRSKLSPFIGDFIAGDQSFFMATYYMYFPFLTCEVKCGAAALDVADRQNAHSMTLAVRALVELFRLVGREQELDRQILAFSVSHDHQMVYIYGHYPVIDGKDTKYYRHPIHQFSFIALDGKEKWTTYQFTKNIYHHWMPAHLKNICSAIDQLPSDLDFGIRSSEQPGSLQNLESHPFSQSDGTSDPIIIDRQPSSTDQQGFTPATSLMGGGPAKRRKSPVKRT
ncbi:hypothetical protein MGYG_05779 [Nannizzia gypsea CBS 118893]|uniref:DUF7924 domain-containing protein n=1 Tax=Arthroderma gypseum (strain ATCC MYA-4604 / CBS 118893) TaxID=535722 RepID=E4UXU8_ARTGP|nr:hypothetical protein MGYG_05779 [Nannizzia gypsea CBS 118893]EFR02780.1 hypothetical protein MGYG_05779 [Nannizzia gypsea CBS 118893]